MTPVADYLRLEPKVYCFCSCSRRPDAGLPEDVPSAVDSALGLKWGNYVGSPSQPRPVVTWTIRQSDPVQRLVAAANNEALVYFNCPSVKIELSSQRGFQVYGACGNATPIIKHDLEGRLTPFMSAQVLGACLVTWGYYDRHIRVKLKKSW